MSPTRVAHQLLPPQKHGQTVPIGAISVLPRPQPAEEMHSPQHEQPHAPMEAHTPTDLKQALAQSMRRPPTPPSDEEVEEPPVGLGSYFGVRRWNVMRILALSYVDLGTPDAGYW